MIRKILFVASNPSASSPDCSAMHESTRSRKILEDWLVECNVFRLYANVSDAKTTKNMPVPRSIMLDNLHSLKLKIAEAMPDHIVALGDTASRALSLISQPHTKLPHPSGLNRKLNDPKVIAEIKSTLQNISLGIIQ
jgi:hypothetical protein